MNRSLALSPHHVGEALVAALLLRQGDRVQELPATDPDSGVTRPLGNLLPSITGAPRSVIPNAPLDPLSTGASFDGMHDIDCAVEFDRSVVALELKLGATRLRPTDFKERFVDKVPCVTHGGKRLAGSMVAILDRNRESVGEQRLELQSNRKRVDQKWGLVVMRKTLSLWRDSGANIATSIGVRNLGAVLALEDLADAVGIDASRDVALELVAESVDRWFR